MRIHKCSPFGEEVDLDDPGTYSHLPQTTKELRKMMFCEIGMTHCYMYYWHKDIFTMEGGIGGSRQIERVEKLIKNFTENEKHNYNNLQWYQEQVFLFQDEVENQC